MVNKSRPFLGSIRSGRKEKEEFTPLQTAGYSINPASAERDKIKGRDKEIIKNNFSRCARVYDQYALIQNSCGSCLIDKVKVSPALPRKAHENRRKGGMNDFKKILDIGCGTGNYTKLLRDKFPHATIRAIDISSEMIEIAKNKLKDKDIEFITADAENHNFRERFDFISSNAAFQWFESLEAVLAEYKKLLNRGGLILFSLFGPRTFYELHRSLEEFSKTNVAISAVNFLEKEGVKKILQSSFQDVKVEERIYREESSSLVQLLRKIKYTGTKGAATKKIFWTKKAISAIEEIYLKKFKSVVATYQVFFCWGRK